MPASAPPALPALWLIVHEDGDVIDVGYGDWAEAADTARDLGPGHLVLPDRGPVEIDGTPTIMSLDRWRSNAEMIRDAVVPMGYLRKDWVVCDPTYGLGVFWKQWKPRTLIASDLEARKSPTGHSVDATDLPMEAESVDAMVLDGPYKLNGRPDVPVDSRYGVHEWATAEGRIQLIRDMMTEAARVLRPPRRLDDGSLDGGIMLVKCQNQVNSARKWWQDQLFTRHAEHLGFTLEDQFLFESYRPQPLRSTCVHCGSKIMRRENGMWGNLVRSSAVSYTCVSQPVGTQTEGQVVAHEPGRLEQDHSASNYSTLLVLRAPVTGAQPALFGS